MAPSTQTYNPAAHLELDVPQHMPAALVAAAIASANPSTIVVHDAELNGSKHADAKAAFRATGATEGRSGLAADGLTARASGETQSLAEILTAADLNWAPVKSALTATCPDGVVRQVPGKHLISRSDTREPLAVVGNKYTTIDHRPLFELGQRIVESAGGALAWANAGHKRDGCAPFAQLKARDTSPVGEVERMISLFTSHDGSTYAQATVKAVCVVVCRNTHQHALDGCKDGLRIRHTASATDIMETIDELCAITQRYGQAWDDNAMRLASTPFTDGHMKALASALAPGESTRSENTRKALMDAFTSSPGAMPGTAWGAAQAVTFYTSHMLGSPEARAETAIFGTGTGTDWQALMGGYLQDDAAIASLNTVKLYRV